MAATLPSSFHHHDEPGRLRRIRPLPSLLLDQSTVCLEEQLYPQAILVLSNALTSGSDGSAPTFVPLPQHLALIATLTVHPQFTTRTESRDRLSTSDDAFRFLRQVVKLGDPKAAGLTNAFRFTGLGTRSERQQRSRGPLHANAQDLSNERAWAIQNVYASTQSLWTHAEDFWALAGWVFNCSVAHHRRWQRWKPLMGLILDVLDDDLESCISQNPPGDVAYNDTLIAQYLSVIGEGRNSRRRVMRAILTDSTPKSLAEFGEIWKGETEPPKQRDNERATKRQKLDLEKGEYGDYFDDESDAETADDKDVLPQLTTPFSARAKRTRALSPTEVDHQLGSIHVVSKPQTPAQSEGLQLFGGMDSIRLRQRLLAILVRLSEASPETFLDTEDLFDLLTEFLRPLPLAVFEQFVLPLAPYLGSDQQASLNEMLFRPMISLSVSNASMRSITQQDFEARYAVQAAINGSAIDNAKVSLLIESLLRALWNYDMLDLDGLDHLRESIETGIRVRKEKVSRDGRRKQYTGDVEDGAMVTLECSAERMRVMLDLLSSTSKNSSQ